MRNMGWKRIVFRDYYFMKKYPKVALVMVAISVTLLIILIATGEIS